MNDKVTDFMKKYGATPVYDEAPAPKPPNSKQIQGFMEKYGATPIYEDSDHSDNQPQPSSDLTGVPLNLAKGFVKMGGGLLDTATEFVQGGAPDDYTSFSPPGSIDPATGKKDIFARREELGDFIQQHNATNKFNFGVAKKHGEVVDTIAGKEVKPETPLQEVADFGGQLLFPFKAKLGGAGGLIDSAKWASIIAPISKVLKESGLTKEQSEVTASLIPLMLAVRKLPGEAIKAISSKIAELTNEEFARGSGVRKASEFLKQKVGSENIPDVVSKIDEYRTPFPGNPEALEKPYRPVTSEIADNVGLSSYHRAKGESIPKIGERRKANDRVLDREVGKLAEKDATPQMAQEFVEKEHQDLLDFTKQKEKEAKEGLRHAQSEFSETASPEMAGGEAQEYLSDRVKSIGDKAREEARPYYEAAKPKSVENGLTDTFKHIDDLIGEWGTSGPIGSDLKKAKEHIKNAIINKGEKQKVSKKYGSNPELEKGLKKLGANLDSETQSSFNVGKLDKAKQQISLMLENIPQNEKTRRGALKGVLSKLEKEMESVPEIFEARKIYSEVMEPANKIKENPILGKIINKAKGFLKSFTVTKAEIPKRLISSQKSVEGAKAFMSEFSGLGTAEHAEVVNTLKSYVNSEILHEFVDKAGKVSPDKFAAWKKQNPGAFIIYPELEGKLSGLKNAQAYVDHIIEMNKQTIKSFEGEAVQHFLGKNYKGKNPSKIAESILDSSNSEKLMDEAVELLGRDETGRAMEGFKKGFIDDLLRRFKSEEFTFATLNDYLKKNKKALSKVFTEDQIKVIEKVRDIRKAEAEVGRVGRQSGSNTTPKLMEALAEKSGQEASKALIGGKITSLAEKVSKLSNKSVEKITYDLLERALLDPKMTKFLLTFDPRKQTKGFKELFTGKIRDMNGLSDLVEGKIRNRSGILKALKDTPSNVFNKDNLYITSKVLGTSAMNRDKD